MQGAAIYSRLMYFLFQWSQSYFSLLCDHIELPFPDFCGNRGIKNLYMGTVHETYLTLWA